ncbi:MAG TPA: DoxX family protein [Chitinophagaceae bacterium]|jgi:uncharacterized membrane protein YphA (DoxX/SURF4 family)|nr:DoxX family protein [Chitinophagaceae bacterium]
MKLSVRSALFGHALPESKPFNLAWALFRFYTGLSMALGAGWPKMNEGLSPGWFTEQVGGLGFTFPSPLFWATVAAWGEFVGGLLIAFGLLTRFSALQLAFQFFVVAFIWYEEPFPFGGMYYQQLLFWSFLLILAGGGGRYSLDALLRGRVPVRIPSVPATALTVLLLTLSGSAALQARASGYPVVLPNLFAPYEGFWKGTLAYTDYGNGKRVRIAVTARLLPAEDDTRQALVEVNYPGEPGHAHTDTLRAPLSATAGSTLTWLEEETGTDNGRPARRSRQFFLSPDSLSIRLDIHPAGTDSVFNRNVYTLERVRN